MSRSLIVGLLLVTSAGLLAWLPLRAAADRPAGPVPKTIILGFDGMDHALTTRWMEAGDLPNFKRLAEQGLFQRLETTNPAQSPVSWAVFNTGCNPGKTGVAGFVSRTFRRDVTGKVRMETEYDTQGRVTFDPVPFPKPMLGDNTTVDAADFVTFPFALHNRAFFILGAAAAGLIAGLLLFKLVLRLPLAAALVIGLGAAALGFWWARSYADALPRDGKLPYVINPMQGTSFWHYLDQRGIRLRGVQVASTYPPDHEGPNTELLSGLGVPDISGSPGSWTVYTTDPWIFGEKDTPTSGLVRKVFEDTPGVLQDDLFGPVNWIQAAEMSDRRAELERLQKESGLSTAELDEVQKQLDAVKAEVRNFNASGGKHNDTCKVPFTMRPDRQAKAVTFEVAGRSFVVEEGAWSEFIPVTFELNSMFKAHGLAIFHVIHCNDEEVRVFVPPINIDPNGVPPQLPISAPADFAARLEEMAGHPYETLGWACITNPLKDQADSKLPEQSFLDDMVSTEALREDLLDASLARPDDWDVYFQIFSTPDRACHMLFREFDPGHPKHDAALAATPVTAFGRTFPLSDAIRQVYMNEDRMLGKVLEALDAGRFGADALLLIVSDHGFSSFRRQVNLNNALNDLGFLQFKFKLDGNGQPTTERTTLTELMAGQPRDHDLLRYVDWSATQAYSLGLGEVFVNLKGREPKGIVEPADYDKVVDDIRAGLLSLKDGDGTPYVSSASRRDALYSGPWWKEGTARRKTVLGREEEVGHDGFGDIFLGYAPYYRVSWGNTMGGLDSATVTDNDNHWSGDHVSVDPEHVPGVLFSNRKLPPGTRAGLIDVAPTLLTRYGIDYKPPATDMDGQALPFENVSR